MARPGFLVRRGFAEPELPSDEDSGGDIFTNVELLFWLRKFTAHVRWVRRNRSSRFNGSRFDCTRLNQNTAVSRERGGALSCCFRAKTVLRRGPTAELGRPRPRGVRLRVPIAVARTLLGFDPSSLIGVSESRRILTRFTKGLHRLSRLPRNRNRRSDIRIMLIVRELNLQHFR